MTWGTVASGQFIIIRTSSTNYHSFDKLSKTSRQDSLELQEVENYTTGARKNKAKHAEMRKITILLPALTEHNT